MQHLPLSILFFLIPCFDAVSQTRYYVNVNVIGGQQTGLTWVDAFIDLQSAIAAAVPNDTIWVAAGIYRPTIGTDRNTSFFLKDSVSVFGGFIGTETALSQRSHTANPTILSGNIGDSVLRADNCYHVIQGTGLSEQTRLDGFIIRDGYSLDGEYPAQELAGSGAGLLLQGKIGTSDSRPVIANCRFEWNYALIGGALAIKGGKFQDEFVLPVNPILKNCEFFRNYASVSGAAIFKNGKSTTDTILVEGCRFIGNVVYNGADEKNGGGGVYLKLSKGGIIKFYNCLFERDSSLVGGGIFFTSTKPDSSCYSIVIDSCVFRQNFALDGGGFCYYPFNLTYNTVVNFVIKNSIFIENSIKNGDGSAFQIQSRYGGRSTVSIENCLFRAFCGIDESREVG